MDRQGIGEELAVLLVQLELRIPGHKLLEELRVVPFRLVEIGEAVGDASCRRIDGELTRRNRGLLGADFAVLRGFPLFDQDPRRRNLLTTPDQTPLDRAVISLSS